VYRKSQNQNRSLLIAALPVALVILFVLFSQLTPPPTMAQQEPTTTALPTDVEMPTPDNLPDPQRQVEEYASIAHALQAQAIADDDPFLAYRLAVEAGSLYQPPAEAYSALLSMYYDTTALYSFRVPLGAATFALSLSEDGQQLSFFGSNSILNLFDTSSSAPIQTYIAPRGYLAGSDFTPDGSTLYVTQPDNQLLLQWDVASGRVRRIAIDQGFGTIKVSPNGQQALAATFYDSNLFLLDLTTHETLMTFPGHPGIVTAINFSPDGNLALAGYYDGSLILYDLTTGITLRTLQYGGDPIYAIAFDPHGGNALVGDNGGRLTLWSITGGYSIYSISNANPGGISSVTYSPNGLYGVTGGSDGTVLVWDVEFGVVVSRTRIHQTYVNRIVFSGDGNTYATGDAAGNALLWGFNKSANVSGFYVHESVVGSVVFSPDGRYAASGDNFGEIRLWDSETSMISETLLGHTGAIRSLDFSPDGRYLLSGSADGQVRLRDLMRGETIQTYTTDDVQVVDASFSPDGRRALMAQDTADALLLDTDPDSDTFGETLQVFETEDAFVSAATYSPDGSVAVGTNAGGIYIWNADTGEEIQHIIVEDELRILSMDYNADGTLLATSLQNNNIALWDVGSGRRLITIEGHQGLATSIDFSPDGRTLLSGGEDTNMILWDVATGQRIRTYEGHIYSVDAVAFSPDGTRALSGSWDFNVHIWDIPSVPQLINHLLSERYVPELTCNQRTAYRVEPYCDSDGNAPTITPFPSVTPTARVTNVFPTPEAFFPTSTLPATAVTTARPAQVGEQRGEIEVGGGEVWTYNGGYGEVLNILVAAENPANDAEQREGLFDTYLIVRSSLGTVLYIADDIESGVVTDSQIYYLTLPTTGVYEIEVRSWNDESGGEYTLTIESIPYVTPTPFQG
jgi:WD40 repeat protein